MNNVSSNNEKASMRQRWNEARVKKMNVFWLCLLSVVVTMILGFTWGGWMTGGGSIKVGRDSRERCRHPTSCAHLRSPV